MTEIDDLNNIQTRTDYILKYRNQDEEKLAKEDVAFVKISDDGHYIFRKIGQYTFRHKMDPEKYKDMDNTGGWKIQLPSKGGRKKKRRRRRTKKKKKKT